MHLLKEQYKLIKDTRESLFQFCDQIQAQDYVKEIEGFGWGSIRNLHVHVAECYHSWLGKFGLKESAQMVDLNKVGNAKEMRKLFKEVDELVFRFLDTYEGRFDQKISGKVSWQEEEEQLTPLWLFTHTMTHEFHHKGQIVSRARQLGYTPTDTDLIPPEKHI
ncbi:putative damage-inducible protein DinB [Thalassobacillus pellis]|nr:DinB family protein [Thalassobacillus pellis]MBM7552104.1 putative damage-inducible protein DinB [Thalassobacillus pellis]